MLQSEFTNKNHRWTPAVEITTSRRARSLFAFARTPRTRARRFVASSRSACVMRCARVEVGAWRKLARRRGPPVAHHHPIARSVISKSLALKQLRYRRVVAQGGHPLRGGGGGLDLKSSGLCPRRFEPCRSRFTTTGSSYSGWVCRRAVRTATSPHTRHAVEQTREWSSGRMAPLPRSRPGFDSRLTHHFVARCSPWRLSSVAEHWSCKPRVGSSILPVAFASAVACAGIVCVASWCGNRGLTVRILALQASGPGSTPGGCSAFRLGFFATQSEVGAVGSAWVS